MPKDNLRELYDRAKQAGKQLASNHPNLDSDRVQVEANTYVGGLMLADQTEANKAYDGFMAGYKSGLR